MAALKWITWPIVVPLKGTWAMVKIIFVMAFMMTRMF